MRQMGGLVSAGMSSRIILGDEACLRPRRGADQAFQGRYIGAGGQMELDKLGSVDSLRSPRHACRGASSQSDQHFADRNIVILADRVLAAAFDQRLADLLPDPISFRSVEVEGSEMSPWVIHDRCIQYPCRSMSVVTPIDGVIGRSLWIAEDFGCCASG